MEKNKKYIYETVVLNHISDAKRGDSFWVFAATAYTTEIALNRSHRRHAPFIIITIDYYIILCTMNNQCYYHLPVYLYYYYYYIYSNVLDESLFLINIRFLYAIPLNFVQWNKKFIIQNSDFINLAEKMVKF